MAERERSGLGPGGTQVRVLRAVADHLERCPGLPQVNITQRVEGWGLQLARSPWDASAGLIVWAESFGVSVLTVRAIPTQVMVHFSVTLAGCPIEVWGCVDSLREALGLTATQSTSITVAALARLAASWGGEAGG